MENCHYKLVSSENVGKNIPKYLIMHALDTKLREVVQKNRSNNIKENFKSHINYNS